MYVQPKRLYRRGGVTSPLLYEVIGDRATINQPFTCGNRRGTWSESPFKQVQTIPAMQTVPADLDVLDTTGATEDPARLFDAICASIERSWDRDKFHVVFHSSGWDSRILSSAVKRLATEHGDDWLGRGLLFLANRWEADEARAIVEAEGWDPSHFRAYEREPHFPLDFATAWQTDNAPIPIPGNLWWYLVADAQRAGVLPEDEHLQGYAGLWANETWNAFILDGPRRWLDRYRDQYYYNILAVLPFKIAAMEFPLSDLEVLRLLKGRRNGDKQREAVARYACPEADHVPHLTLDDRGKPIGEKQRRYCLDAYKDSWYGRHVRKNWQTPLTSEFSVEWARWGLASLCEELRRRGVDVRAK